MKRSPLKRGKPKRRKPKSTKYSRRERDFDYMGWIKRQDCMMATDAVTGDLWKGGRPAECRGVTEAHHAGRRGMGQKADDDTCLPLCAHHHHMRTDHLEVFANWYPGAMREWEDSMIARYQAAWRTVASALSDAHDILY